MLGFRSFVLVLVANILSTAVDALPQYSHPHGPPGFCPTQSNPGYPWPTTSLASVPVPTQSPSTITPRSVFPTATGSMKPWPLPYNATNATMIGTNTGTASQPYGTAWPSSTSLPPILRGVNIGVGCWSLEQYPCEIIANHV